MHLLKKYLLDNQTKQTSFEIDRMKHAFQFFSDIFQYFVCILFACFGIKVKLDSQNILIHYLIVFYLKLLIYDTFTHIFCFTWVYYTGAGFFSRLDIRTIGNYPKTINYLIPSFSGLQMKCLKCLLIFYTLYEVLNVNTCTIILIFLISRAGITFVSVHDCFWTHPCDVETMNKV